MRIVTLLLTFAAAAVLSGSATPAETSSSVLQIASMRLDGTDVRTLSDPNLLAAAPVPAPDGRIAFIRVGEPSELWVMAADGSGKRRLTTVPADTLAGAAWSPTGRELAFGSWDYSPCTPSSRNCATSELRLVDAEIGADRLVTRSRDRGAGAFSWAPDGRRLAYAGALDFGLQAHTLEVVRSDGTGRRLLVRDDRQVRDAWLTGVAWSPRGDRIAFVRGGWIWLVEASGGPPVRLARGSLPLWSPRGDRLLHAVFGTLRIVDPATRRSRLLVKAAGTTVPVWSRDGRRIALRRISAGRSAVSVVRVADGRALFAPSVPGKITTMFFTRDGDRLVYATYTG